MSLPIYGLDKELAEKQASKYDVEKEKEAKYWIEEVLREPFPPGDFQENLKDGVILTRLANAVCKTNLKPQVSKMPFKQMENINNFLQAMDKIGVPKFDQFQTIDLYESKNPTQVLLSLFALSRHAAKNGFDGPLLGPKLADKHEVSFSDEQLNAGKFIPSQQMGYTGGANASGIIYGARREIGGVDPGKKAT
ncbi:calponin homology domain-containing protein [Gorgonomyces haynaldii]|nr:calponin homology domain-containing protein [Gorgonomyces haynaldii]